MSDQRPYRGDAGDSGSGEGRPAPDVPQYQQQVAYQQWLAHQAAMAAYHRAQAQQAAMAYHQNMMAYRVGPPLQQGPDGAFYPVPPPQFHSQYSPPQGYQGWYPQYPQQQDVLYQEPPVYRGVEDGRVGNPAIDDTGLPLRPQLELRDSNSQTEEPARPSPHQHVHFHFTYSPAVHMASPAAQGAAATGEMPTLDLGTSVVSEKTAVANITKKVKYPDVGAAEPFVFLGAAAALEQRVSPPPTSLDQVGWNPFIPRPLVIIDDVGDQAEYKDSGSAFAAKDDKVVTSLSDVSASGVIGQDRNLLPKS